MKALVVTTEYGNGANGGVESVVSFLLEAVADLTDWDVEVASLRMSRTAPQSRRLLQPQSWFRAPRIDVRTVRHVVVHDVGSALAELEMIRFLPRSSLDRFADGVDVVVVVSGTPAAAYALKRTRTPVILQVATLVAEERRESDARLSGMQAAFRRVMTRMTSRLDEGGLKVPALILVENPRMLAECQSRGLSNVLLRPPGVDTDDFRPGVRSDIPYILTVARLDDLRKNVSGLLRAFARARELDDIPHKMILAGGSPPSGEDFALMADLGLQTVVEVQSPVSAAELLTLYQGADLFVSASFEEGLGLTYLEAMACGVPVVTTKNAGAEFILDGSSAGATIRFGQNFLDEFAAELARWCLDDELRTLASLEARELVVGRFSTRDAARAFIEAIQTVR